MFRADTGAIATKPRVLVVPGPTLYRELFTPAADAALRELADVTFNPRDLRWSPAELADALGGIDAVITGWGTPTFSDRGAARRGSTAARRALGRERQELAAATRLRPRDRRDLGGERARPGGRRVRTGADLPRPPPPAPLRCSAEARRALGWPEGLRRTPT